MIQLLIAEPECLLDCGADRRNFRTGIKSGKKIAVSGPSILVIRSKRLLCLPAQLTSFYKLSSHSHVWETFSDMKK